MAESGVIEALLELLRCHKCEETAARLLEVLLNNVKIRETKAAKSAISQLSQYLLDPQTQAQQARLLATLALGDLFQNETPARTTDALSACRALDNLLEDQPTDEMKVVAICALQNLVMYSRSNKRAVAEAGAVQVGNERFNIFSGCPSGQTTTIVLRGEADQFIEEAERSLHEAIMIVRRALKNNTVVAGGGAIDMEISKYL